MFRLRECPYRELRVLAPLRLIGEHHVFAVPDFISLLKRLWCDLAGLTAMPGLTACEPRKGFRRSPARLCS
ncbi:MAG: DUF3050 domain-containing protein [Firmicutes bacterium]|nr:DUF3050 domain-containing protein [Bacillota bacterium]